MKIKFGTDGWRAIIAKDFTVENVARVTIGVAEWLKKNHLGETSVVIGYDCRFAGDMFAETAAKVLSQYGIKTLLGKGFVSTPMVSFATTKYHASLGIIFTASHNPAAYNGFKLKGHFGGPLLPGSVKEIEELIPEKNAIDVERFQIEDITKKGLVSIIDMEDMYCEHIEKNFDLPAIRKSGLKLAYDAMYGSGQNVIKRLLPETILFRCEYNPTFYGVAPEPIMRNLKTFAGFINKKGNIDMGLITDGDADRLGLMDGKGNFIDSHHIILLLIHYLCKYKGFKGKVCTGFSSTVKIRKMCEHYGLPLDVVPIGFKYICSIMLKEDVLVGGEESGGIAIKGHIPERDGIWVGLTLLEFMAKSGKTINELIKEVYSIVGSFAFERIDLTIAEEKKQQIVENCKNGVYNSFGAYMVQRLETIDGFKYILNDSEWVMIRASGTEPVLRTYAESSTQEKALEILKATHSVIFA